MFIGRQPEARKLARDFSKVQAGGGCQAMVQGPAGVGKTALVREFALEAEAGGGCFIFGKADLRDSRTPLAPVAAALDMMVKKFIADHPRDMAEMAGTLSRALGDHLGPAAALVPALKFLVGDAALQSPKGGGDDDPSFSFYLLYTLIEAFASRFRGLVIFVDDLQWLDPASHGFLSYWAVAPPLAGTFLILGFRNREKRSHPLLARTRAIFKDSEACRQITLKGLPKRDINTWLKHRLDSGQNFSPLASLCFEKTRGNPFYLTQMVADLMERGTLRQKGEEWIYDPEAVSRLEICENVADLVISRIRLVREDVLMLLKHGACLKEGITLEVLSASTRFPEEKLKALLWEARKFNFLEKKGEGWAFAHDKILEAAAGLLPPEEKGEIHRRIVDFYRSKPDARPGVSVFTLLFHYGVYKDRVTDGDLKKAMVPLYLDAGQKARTQGAYEQAISWFSQGKAHYPGDIWEEDYPLALEFCRGCAHCAYLAGDFTKAEAVFREIDGRAVSFEDRMDTEMVKISCLQAKGKLNQALAKGIETLRNLGVRIPANPSRPRIGAAILRTWARLGLGLSPPGPEKEMPGRIRDIIRVMTALGGIAYSLSPEKFLPYITALTLGLTLRHGSTPQTPTLYVAFGMVLNRVTGSVTWGRRLSAAARKASREWGRDSLTGQEMLLAHFFLDHWDLTMQETIAACEQGQKICLRHGDHEYYGYHTLVYAHALLFSGRSLDQIIPALIRQKEVLRRLNHRYGETVLSMRLSALENLKQGRPRPWDLDLEEDTHLRLEDGGLGFDLAFYRFSAAFLSGNMAAALELKGELDSVIEEVRGTPCYPFYCFMAALVEIFDGKPLRKWRRPLGMLKQCASNNPGYYGPRVLIVRGEVFRAQNRLDRANALFKAAEKALEKNPDALYEKGLVKEKLGWIARSRDREEEAAALMRQAEDLYRSWGLPAKPGVFEADPAGARGPAKPEPARIPDDPESALAALRDRCGAHAVHAVVRDGLNWKTLLTASAEGVDRPAASFDLPEKMLSFAGTAGTPVRATAEDSEAAFFDTAYFFRHSPVSLAVIPGGKDRGIFFENPEKEPDQTQLTALTEAVFRSLKPRTPVETEQDKYDPQYLDRIKSCCARLQDHMRRNQPYKNPDLNLAALSRSLGFSQRMITDAVNTCLSQNVQTFINSHRIEAVKSQIRYSKDTGKTVLEIALEQGFNSKSTFNRSFKAMTGMTPSAYRRKFPRSEGAAGKS